MRAPGKCGDTLNIGPSGVRALPLGVAVERSVLYFCDYFSFFLFPFMSTAQLQLSELN